MKIWPNNTVAYGRFTGQIWFFSVIIMGLSQWVRIRYVYPNYRTMFYFFILSK